MEQEQPESGGPMRKAKKTIWVLAALPLILGACAGVDAAEENTTTTEAPTTTPAEVTTTEAPEMPTTTASALAEADHDPEVDTAALAEANLGTAAFQDVALAEAAGYVNTIESLGCFEDPETGGMGLHYLNESLLDDALDPGTPEALVYELDDQGEIVDLVAHEYLVPLEAWTADEPPSLFGVEFHEHPVLPFWILHTWIWKDNPLGMFTDWNPKVRPCPEGAPIFGVDLP
jgi:hypothetical protein